MKNTKTLLLAGVLVLILVLGGIGYRLLAGNRSAGLSEPAPAGDTDPAQASPDAPEVVDDEAALETGDDNGEAPEPVSYTAPNITIYDRDGEAVPFETLFGQPIVLNFWASWCPPCKNEMPEFDEVYREMGDEIRFVMVDLTDGGQETMEDGLAFIEEAGYSFPVYFDLDLEAYYTYRLTSIPMTVFIDAEGNLVTRAVGAINRETLLEGISMISGESSVY